MTTGNIEVCLVHTPCHELNDDRLEAPLGLLYLATVLKARGLAVQLLDLSSSHAPDLAALIPDGCRIYGFSTYSVNYGLTRALASAVRARNGNALFVAGGPHASALPEQVAADGFDVVVLNEGEVAIVQILEAIDRGQPLPKILNADLPDVNALPHPDYELIEMGTYHRQVNGHACLSVLSSRGCPYKCTFCNSNIMGAGKPMRYRDVQDVAKEIRELKEEYGIRHFRFQDDIFTIHKKRIAELTPLLSAEEIEYRCFSRINTCSSEMAQMLRAGGCVHASFGVESGSPKILSAHAMNKGQTPEQIAWALTNAHKAGLRTRIFLIVGFPGETDQTIEETLSLLKRIPWDEFSVYPLIAYPGTPLHDDPERFGITHIDRNYSDYLQIGKNYRAGFTIRTTEFDEHKVRQWRDHVMRELLDDGRTWSGNAVGFK